MSDPADAPPPAPGSLLTKSNTLCLNMIVKNESKIITRMLESVAPFLHSYCICDTGSTDDTPAVIRAFFESRGIPGEVVSEPFRDFGYNRSFALTAANERSTADYLLLLDADMILAPGAGLSPEDIRARLTGDTVHLFQGNHNFFYKNTRLVRNRPGYSYWGVTHEYVATPKGATSQILDRDVLFISDVGDGGSKGDKQIRDIRLLEQGLRDVPNNDRYTFYLANSYRDHGELEKAIEFYRKRVGLGGWAEECWHSLYSIGRCYQSLGDMPRAVYSWLEAYNHTPGRLEALYEVVKHFRVEGKHALAYHFYALADAERRKGPKWDCLFLQKDKYEFRLDYEFSIVGYYCNPEGRDLARISMGVIAAVGADEGMSKNVLSNYKFYSKDLEALSQSASTDNLRLLAKVGDTLMAPFQPEFVGSTPCVLSLSETELLVVRRFVNYSIDDKGQYINRECITTKNVAARIDISGEVWRVLSEAEVLYDTSLDGRYVGLEDMRVFRSEDGTVRYNGNRGMQDGTMQIEEGMLRVEEDGARVSCSGARRLSYKKQTRCEKNWVFFAGAGGAQKCVYKWSPLTLGDVDVATGEFHETHAIATPAFFRFLRGSTNGVVIGDEVWMLAHAVSYEDRRYYYHIMVVLDRTTFAVLRWSPFFTFRKEKVEYTLGFSHIAASDTLVIGYSTMDRETHFVSVDRSVFGAGGALEPI